MRFLLLFHQEASLRAVGSCFTDAAQARATTSCLELKLQVAAVSTYSSCNAQLGYITTNGGANLVCAAAAAFEHKHQSKTTVHPVFK